MKSNARQLLRELGFPEKIPSKEPCTVQERAEFKILYDRMNIVLDLIVEKLAKINHIEEITVSMNDRLTIIEWALKNKGFLNEEVK